MSASALRLQYRVQDIVEQGGLAVEGSLPPEQLFTEPVKEASPAGPVKAGLEFSVGSDSVLLMASVSGGWRVACSRCLVEHVVAYSASAEETFPADAEQIDVTETLRETALLEIPQRSLCRADCRGLCPRCGKDLNQGACACPPEKGSPFAVLKRLKE